MYDYKRMDTAPMDGSVVMVLCGAKWPVAAYWEAKGKKSVQDGEWRTAITDKPIVPAPSWWTSLPAQAPTDYLQSLEHLPFVIQGGVWPDRYSDSAAKELVEKLEEETTGKLTDKPLASKGVPQPPEATTGVSETEGKGRHETKAPPETEMFRASPPKPEVAVSEPTRSVTGKTVEAWPNNKSGKGSRKR